MLLKAARFGDRCRSTLSWRLRIRISACNAACDRISPAMAHQTNRQRSLMATIINRSQVAVSRLGFPTGTGGQRQKSRSQPELCQGLITAGAILRFALGQELPIGGVEVEFASGLTK